MPKARPREESRLGQCGVFLPRNLLNLIIAGHRTDLQTFPG